MLRSRGARPGRFHRSAKTRSCAYLSSAGATILTSSRLTIEFDFGMAFLSCAWVDELTSVSEVIATTSSLMSASLKSHVLLRTRERITGGPRTRRVENGSRDACRAERSQHAGDEHHAEIGEVREQPESGGAEPERHVEKGGVSA